MGFLASALGMTSNFKAQGVDQNRVNTGLDAAGNMVGQQQSFVNALQPGGTQGLAAQQQLLQMLQSQAQGGGPNPAQDMLNQTTGQNMAQQAALQGSQRGVGQNAGMLARQVAQQGGQIGQNAAGQAATMRAQQTLAAQQMLGGQANQMVGQQSQGLGQLNAAQQGLTGQILGANNSQNEINANTASKNASAVGGLLGGVGGAAVAGAGGMGKIGAVLGLADGGEVGPSSHVGKYFQEHEAQSYKSGGHVGGETRVEGDSPKNDTVPAMLSPGEIVVPRSAAQDPKKAAAFAAAVAMRKSKKGAK